MRIVIEWEEHGQGFAFYIGMACVLYQYYKCSVVDQSLVVYIGIYMDML